MAAKKVTRFWDIEQEDYVSIEQLFEEYKQALLSENIDIMTFDEYIINCLTRFNGTLEYVD